MMSSRCTGHCCRSFVLRYGADDRKIHSDWIEGWLEEPDSMGDDTVQVLSMVIPLDEHEDEEGELYSTFTCKNFDVEEQRCLIYSTRPRMCRRFGSEVECNYEGCTFLCSKSTKSGSS